MYKGYKLNIGDEATKAFSEKEILDLGTPLVLENKKIIKGSLDKFRFDEDGIIDGTVMQQEWFPEIEADIFISHSHKDEQVAIGLAGFLNKVHGLSSFIDSTVWKYSNDLLKQLDLNFSKSENDTKYFDYQKRNNSTSHVHMMLASALSMMIDKCECLIFLNTPNSMYNVDDINKTYSPWIYHEILVSKLIRKKIPDGPRMINEKFNNYHGSKQEELIVSYNLDTDHLIETDIEVLIDKWAGKKYENKFHSLDELYKLIK